MGGQTATRMAGSAGGPQEAMEWDKISAPILDGGQGKRQKVRARNRVTYGRWRPKDAVAKSIPPVCHFGAKRTGEAMRLTMSDGLTERRWSQGATETKIDQTSQGRKWRAPLKTMRLPTQVEVRRQCRRQQALLWMRSGGTAARRCDLRPWASEMPSRPMARLNPNGGTVPDGKITGKDGIRGGGGGTRVPSLKKFKPSNLIQSSNQHNLQFGSYIGIASFIHS